MSYALSSTTTSSISAGCSIPRCTRGTCSCFYNLLVRCSPTTDSARRTLTPFGFQAEERTLWQAPDTYQLMSPFNHADRIKKPLLLIHGEADENPGKQMRTPVLEVVLTDVRVLLSNIDDC